MNEIPIIFVGVAGSCFSTGRSVGSDHSRLVQSDTCAVIQRFHGEGVIKPTRIGGHRDCQRLRRFYCALGGVQATLAG